MLMAPAESPGLSVSPLQISRSFLCVEEGRDSCKCMIDNTASRSDRTCRKTSTPPKGRARSGPSDPSKILLTSDEKFLLLYRLEIFNQSVQARARDRVKISNVVAGQAEVPERHTTSFGIISCSGIQTAKSSRSRRQK